MPSIEVKVALAQMCNPCLYFILLTLQAPGPDGTDYTSAPAKASFIDTRIYKYLNFIVFIEVFAWFDQIILQ
jgi:hypothetical protein